MRPGSPALLIPGWFLFLAGAALVLWGIGGGAEWSFGVGVGVLVGSALLLALGRMTGRSPKDPLELRRQRRLWKSGPLGRWWLERRNRLP